MDKSVLRRARTSGRGGRVHFIRPQIWSGDPGWSLCGKMPTSGLSDPEEIGRWHWTADDVDCLVCETALWNGVGGCGYEVS